MKTASKQPKPRAKRAGSILPLPTLPIGSDPALGRMALALYRASYPAGRKR